MTAKSRLLIACAGSGKTTYLVNEALAHKTTKYLFTTFTDNNSEEIRKKFFKNHGCVPSNVTILPWFSFEIQDLIKPFEHWVLSTQIKGTFLVEGKSQTWTTKENDSYYLTPTGLLYTDKISVLADRIIEKTKGLTLKRLSRLYDAILIDEIQDMSGYDLTLIRRLMIANFPLLMAGDPRQKTFSTHEDQKFLQYKSSNIDFFKKECINFCEIDSTTLSVSHRCSKEIMKAASLIFPEFGECYGDPAISNDGKIFFLPNEEISNFINKNEQVMQLRYNRRTKVSAQTKVMTMGESKGTEFENSLIYPTKEMEKAISTKNYTSLASLTRAKLYVALTRAKHNVGIVLNKE